MNTTQKKLKRMLAKIDSERDIPLPKKKPKPKPDMYQILAKQNNED